MNIDISRNNGQDWYRIKQVTNTGTYPWKVTGPASARCLIRVSATGSSPDPWDQSNAKFKIKVLAGANFPSAETDLPPGDADIGAYTLKPGSDLPENPDGMKYTRGGESGLPDCEWQITPDSGMWDDTVQYPPEGYAPPDPEPPPGGDGGGGSGGEPDGGGTGEPVDLDYTPPVGSEAVYYVYGLGGKLLAEYDSVGNLTRDYIYAGNRLIAEYHPPVPPATEGTFYYYTPYQINSTRVVTNQSGVREYAYTYDPYGGTLKVTDATFQPTLTFSGKERDQNTQLDYFGARYYSHELYRWISPDPVVPRGAAMVNPQAWNLYSYARNNPLRLFDPDGREVQLADDATRAIAALRQTVPLSDRAAIQSVKTPRGPFVDARALNAHKSTSGNYTRLRQLANSSALTQVFVATATLSTRIKGYEQVTFDQPASSRAPEGLLGLTLLPHQSVSGNTQVFLNPYLMPYFAAETLAHELVHANFQVVGLDPEHRYHLVQTGESTFTATDLNLDLNAATSSAVQEADENFNPFYSWISQTWQH